VAVEVKEVLHCFARVSVSEVFDGGGRISDWISRAEKASEFIEEELGVLEPCCRSIDEISLEPIKWRTLQVQQDEGDFAISSGKSTAQRMMYSEHWRMKVSSFIGSEPSKVSRARGLACIVGCRTGGRLVRPRRAEISSSTLRRHA